MTGFLIDTVEYFIRKRIILRIFLPISGFPPISDNNIAVFKDSLLNKGPVVNNLLRLQDILITHKKFFTKPCNLLVVMNYPEMESIIIIIFKDESDKSGVINLKDYLLSRQSASTNIVEYQSVTSYH